MALFKDEDNIRIHRTRVIHIYEVDFNLMLGLKWRVAVYQAEALKALNEGQYGSWPRRSAVDPVMLEEFQFEISRLSRLMLLQTNYDAMACYDRIIPKLAVIVSQKYGVHPKVTQANAKTLQYARYKVKTDLGRELKQIIKVIIFLGGAFTATRYVPFPSQIILQIGVETCRAGKSRFSGKEMLDSPPPTGVETAGD